MSKRDQPARVIQRLTGWRYTRALSFVRDNQVAADSFAVEDGCTPKDALIRMATAECEAE